jgi:hypothetical protein
MPHLKVIEGATELKLGRVLWGMTGMFLPMVYWPVEITAWLTRRVFNILKHPFKTIDNIWKTVVRLSEWAGKGFIWTLEKIINGIVWNVFARIKGVFIIGKLIFRKNEQIVERLDKLIAGVDKVDKGIRSTISSLGKIIRRGFTALSDLMSKYMTFQALFKAMSMGLDKLSGIPGLKGLLKNIGKIGVKKIPVVGAIIGGTLGLSKMAEGDIVGGALEMASGLASTIPGIGTAASTAIDLYNYSREFHPQEVKQQAINNTLLQNAQRVSDEIQLKQVQVINPNTNTQQNQNNQQPVIINNSPTATNVINNNNATYNTDNDNADVRVYRLKPMIIK